MDEILHHLTNIYFLQSYYSNPRPPNSMLLLASSWWCRILVIQLFFIFRGFIHNNVKEGARGYMNNGLLVVQDFVHQPYHHSIFDYYQSNINMLEMAMQQQLSFPDTTLVLRLAKEIPKRILKKLI